MLPAEVVMEGFQYTRTDFNSMLAHFHLQIDELRASHEPQNQISTSASHENRESVRNRDHDVLPISEASYWLQELTGVF